MNSLRHVMAIVAAFAASAASEASAATDNAAQVQLGESVYSRCLACHALAYDRTGPRHCGLLGRRAGTVPGFAYSDAMKKSGIAWNEATLDRFLADPMGSMPGTSMGYAGVKDDKERRALIAYLKHANDSAECRR